MGEMNGSAILVANDGGHLMQLHSLSDRLPIPDDRIWITTPTEQSKSLLRGAEVLWVGPGPTRDLTAVFKNAWSARGAFRSRRVTHAVSTGSSLALSVLPQARARGAEAFYIESATRLEGPSVTGRILRGVPGIACYTQYQSWSGPGWKYLGWVFDGYQAESRSTSLKSPSSVVVSLGTSRTYGFRRLISQLRRVLPAGAEVLWQTGSTDVSGLGIHPRPYVPAQELQERIRSSDLVVAHAGTGIALTALESGKLPVLVPREPGRNEHVDDHQQQIAAALAERGLAVVRDVDSIRPEDLELAMAHRVVRYSSVRPLSW